MITLSMAHIIIGVIMFGILCLMVYVQGRIDQYRKDGVDLGKITALKDLCNIYCTVGEEAMGVENFRKKTDELVVKRIIYLEKEYEKREKECA